jgi:hypothetical protein
VNRAAAGIQRRAVRTLMSTGTNEGAAMDDLDLWVRVTDDDIRVARRLWLAALDDDLVPVSRVTQLYDDLRRVIHTQAQQLADEFRATQRAASDDRSPARPAD